MAKKISQNHISMTMETMTSVSSGPETTTWSYLMTLREVKRSRLVHRPQKDSMSAVLPFTISLTQPIKQSPSTAMALAITKAKSQSPSNAKAYPSKQGPVCLMQAKALLLYPSKSRSIQGLRFERTHPILWSKSQVPLSHQHLLRRLLQPCTRPNPRTAT